MAEPTKKGASVRLETFQSWGVGEIIGHQVDDNNQVTLVWCKWCAKHADKLRGGMQGQALNDFEKYVQGSEFVTKHTVVRHITQSNVHKKAVELEQLESGTVPAKATGSGHASTASNRSQPKINMVIQMAAREGYR
jgi:hypothetical protein